MDSRTIDLVMDAILAPLSIALLVAYHIFLFYKVRTNPMHTVLGINQKARRLWVYEMLIENSKKNVLAVQTLRNSIMESTLMATTAVLIIAALATFFTFVSNNNVHGFPTTGMMSSAITNTLKPFALISMFMISFLCHTQSIRFINHVNYMVNVPMDSLLILLPPSPNLSPADYLADLLERSTIFYSMGSRAFYVGFPLLLWVFGSLPLFLSSLILLHALYTSDFVQLQSLSHNIPSSPFPHKDFELQS